MINFCPMCGSKVIAGSKFCNGCGLNLTEYQQKLDKLMGTSPIQTKSTNTGNTGNTNKNIIPLKTKNPPVHSELDGNPNFNMQEYILSLDKDYDYLDNIYFNLQREKNQRKISAAKKAYANEAKNENIIFVFDDTLFGAADDGFLVTDNKIYVHNSDGDAFNIPHAAIKSYSFEKDVFAKKTIGRKIILNGEKKITLNSYMEPQTKSLIALLKKIQATFCGQVAPKISAPTTTPASNQRLSPPQSSPRQAKSRYYTEDTYVCDNPEAERFFQLFKTEKDDPVKKIDYLATAAEKGHVIAQYTSITLLYLKTSRDDEASNSYLKSLSATQIENSIRILNNVVNAGLVEAMALLGHVYFEGRLVQEDLSKAHYWYAEYLKTGLNTRFSDLVNKRFQYLENEKDIQATVKEAMNNTKKVLQTVVLYNRDAIERIEATIPLKCFYFNGANRSQKARDKLRAALDSYCAGLLIDGEFAVACFDSTTLGSADEGCLFTNRVIYIHNPSEDVKFISYENIDKNSIAVRGVILKDAYIGNIKICTSVCSYDEDEHVRFFAIILAFKNAFGE